MENNIETEVLGPGPIDQSSARADSPKQAKRSIERRGARRLDADLLTPGEVERLIRVCSNRAPTGIRNRALIALAWRCGLRLGEVLALMPKDIDLDAATVIVQHGKGDRRRVVGLDAGTRRSPRPVARGQTEEGTQSGRSRLLHPCWSADTAELRPSPPPSAGKKEPISRSGFMHTRFATLTLSNSNERGLLSAPSATCLGTHPRL